MYSFQRKNDYRAQSVFEDWLKLMVSEVYSLLLFFC